MADILGFFFIVNTVHLERWRGRAGSTINRRCWWLGSVAIGPHRSNLRLCTLYAICILDS